MSHFFEVIVLSADSETLLRVGRPVCLRSDVAEEDVLELVHSGIGKHESWVVLYDHRRRRNNRMSLGCEEIQKFLSYFVRCHSDLKIFIMSSPSGTILHIVSCC